MIEGPDMPCLTSQTIYMLNYIGGSNDSVVSSIWKLSPSIGSISVLTKTKVQITWKSEGDCQLTVNFITSQGDSFMCARNVHVIKNRIFEIYSSLNKKCKAFNGESGFEYCVGDSTSFFTDSVPSYNYLWWLDSIPLNSKSYKTEVLHFNSIGSHTLKLIAFDSIGGCSYTFLTTVNIVDLPHPVIAIDGVKGDSIHICRDQRLRFMNKTTPSKVVLFLWKVIDANNQTVYSFSTDKLEDFIYIFKNSGNYTVRLTATNCNGCSDFFDYNVEVSSLTAITILCPSVVCQDSTKEVLYEAQSNCSSYIWKVIGSNRFRTSGRKLWVIWDKYPVGGYGRIILKASGCSGQVCSEETMVEVPILPTITQIDGDKTFCSNTGVSTHSVPDWPGANYNWSIIPSNDPNLTIVKGQNTHEVTIKRNPYSGSFILKVSVDHPLADCNFTVQQTINVHNITLANDTICNGSPLTINFNSGGSTIVSAKWKFRNFTTTIFNSNQVTIPGSETKATSKSYTISVEVRFSTGATCTSSALIFIKPAVVISHTKGPIVICLDSTYKYSNLTTVGTREWLVAGGNIISISSNTRDAMIQWTAYGINNKFVYVRNLLNGCYSSWDTLSVSDYDHTQVQIMGNPTPCEDSRETYEILGFPPNNKYQWTLSPAGIGQIIRSSNNDIIINWNNINKDTSVLISYRDSTCGLHIYTYKIKIKNRNKLEISSDNLCTRRWIDFSVNANAMRYVWDFGDGLDTVSTDKNPIRYRFDSKGYYNVSVRLIDPLGCIEGSFARKLIEVLPTIESHFYVFDSVTNSLINCLDPDSPRTIIFKANSLNEPNIKYHWFINGVEQTSDTLSSMKRHYPADADFVELPVALYIEGLLCSDTVSRKLPLCTPLSGCNAIDTVRIISVTDVDCIEKRFTGEFKANFDKFLIDTVRRQKGPITQTILRRGFWQFEDNVTERKNIVINADLINIPHFYQGAGYWNVILLGNARNDTDTTKICERRATRIVYVPYAVDFIYTFTCSDTGYAIILKSQISYQPEFPPRAYNYIIDGVTHTSSTGLIEIPISSGTHSVCLEVTFGNNLTCNKCLEITTPVLLGSPSIVAPDTICEGSSVKLDISDSDFKVEIRDFVWIFNDTDTSRQSTPSRVVLIPNSWYHIKLMVTNKWGCTSFAEDSIYIMDNNLAGNISVDSMACASKLTLHFNKTSGRTPLQYSWSSGDHLADIVIAQSGSYNITIVDPYNCRLILQKEIELTESFLGSLTGPTEICANDINPLYTFVGNTSLYDYKLSERQLPNGSVTTRALTSNSDFYNFIISLNGKSGTYELVIRAYQKNSSTVCDSMIHNLTIHAVEIPSIIDSFNNCRPFTYTLHEQNSRIIEWNYIRGNTNYPLGSGSSIIVDGGGLYTGIYVDQNACSTSDSILLEPANDLRLFISGCYDICDTIIDKGHVFIPQLDGNRIYKSWKYVHVDSNRILKQGSNSIVDSLLLTKNLEGKIYLVVEDNHGCIDSSDLLCLSVSECVVSVNCDTFTMTCPHLSFSKDSFDCVNMMGYYEINGEIVVGGDYNLCTPDPFIIDDFIWVTQPTITRMGNVIKISGGKLKMPVDSCKGFIDIYVRLCKNGAECIKLLPHYEFECYNEACGLYSVVTIPQSGNLTRLQLLGYVDNKANCQSNYNYIKVTLLQSNCQTLVAEKYVQKFEFNKFLAWFDIPDDSLRNCYCVRVSLCSGQNNCMTSCEIPFVCNGVNQLKSSGGSDGINMDIVCNSPSSGGMNHYTFSSDYDQNQFNLFIDSIYLFSGDNYKYYCNDGDCGSDFDISTSITSMPSRFIFRFPDYPIVCAIFDTSYNLPNCNLHNLKSFGKGSPFDNIHFASSLNQKVTGIELVILPNPSSEMTYFRYNNIVPYDSKIAIYSIDGTKEVAVLQCNPTGQSEFNAESLAAGVYYVILREQGKSSSIQKWVVIR